MSAPIPAVVLGGTGYVAGELLRLIATHPRLKLAAVMYKGKTFVVKAGGGVFAEMSTTRALVEQIGILHYFGVRVVLVHGGGPQLTALSAALGVPTRVVEGRRVTDEKSIDVTAMVSPTSITKR